MGSASEARVTLVAARTRSIAGSVQVVARSVETALHKLDTLGFDLSVSDIFGLRAQLFF